MIAVIRLAYRSQGFQTNGTTHALYSIAAPHLVCNVNFHVQRRKGEAIDTCTIDYQTAGLAKGAVFALITP